MIVCLRPFTMQGVRYGPPARPDFFRAQLVEARARLAALEADWAEREQVAEIKSLLTNYGPYDRQRENAAYAEQHAELVSCCERLQAQIAEEELPVLQVMPKAAWDRLPKYKQRNFLSCRFVQQREGRKLQEA